MSFDDELRASLDAAGNAVDPVRPPVAELAARARRRRQRVAMTASGGVGAIVIALVATFAFAGGSGNPTTKLGTASAGATTSTLPETGATTEGGITAGTAVTAVAPPATVVGRPTTTTTRPSATTTTRPGATTTAPATSGDVVVTQDDAGKTFTLRRGQRLVVNLTGAGWDYSEPATDNGSVLALVSGHADDATGDATATFVGAGAGQAHVSASKDAPCRKSTPPCMVATFMYQITINVQ